MKLSFSTNRWTGFALDDFFNIAKEYKFNGIEIHNVKECNPDNFSSARRKLLEYNISIPCIDMTSDIAGIESFRI